MLRFKKKWMATNGPTTRVMDKHKQEESTSFI